MFNIFPTVITGGKIILRKHLKKRSTCIIISKTATIKPPHPTFINDFHITPKTGKFEGLGTFNLIL